VAHVFIFNLFQRRKKMNPVPTPAVHNCTFTPLSLTPPQTIEEGVSIIERVLNKDLLCMHDVEVLNHTYLALDRLERQQSKIPERNSSTVLKMIAEKIDAITKGVFGSRGLISLYYLQRFTEERLQLAGRFENFRTSISFNEEEVATHLCNCDTEEQFDRDVEALIGPNINEAVNPILYQKKEKFRLIAEKERKIEAVREKWRMNGSSCVCPLTLALITDPVLDEHGHSFERRALVTRLKTQPVCPMNDKPLAEEQLIPNDDLKEQIESYKAQGFPLKRRERKDVPQAAASQPDPELASFFLSKAQELEQKQQFGEAEGRYIKMLEYTSRSEDYVHLPVLFEKKGEKERAAAAYVVLADLQRSQGKLEEEIVTLEKSLTLASNCIVKERLAIILYQKGQKERAAQLYLELARQALYNRNKLQSERCCEEVLEIIPGCGEAWKLKAVIKSNQSLEILQEGAGETTMSLKERISLCKMIMLKEDPTQWHGRELLVELKQIKIENKMSQLKRRISEMTNAVPTTPIQSAERTTQLSAVQKMSSSTHAAQQPVQAPSAVQATAFALPAWVFGAAEWNKYFGEVGAEPPLPLHIIARLDELSANNVLVMIPKTINGVPLTLKAMGELVQKPLNGGHATKYRNLDLGEYGDPPNSESHWALLTRTVIEGSRNKHYVEEYAILATYSQKTNIAYEIPTILGTTVCLFVEYVRSKTWLYGEKPWTYTFCQDEHKSAGPVLEPWRLVVGGGNDSGLCVYGGFLSLGGMGEPRGVGGLLSSRTMTVQHL
jgi:tetratricopeptide (TPR) repeat protein